MNPFASLQYSDPILQQYYLTVQQSLLAKSLEGDTTTSTKASSTSSSSRDSASAAPAPGTKKNRVVKMTSSFSLSSSAVPGVNGTSGIANNVTPIPSSASSVTSYSGTASGSTSGSGSESDVSSLAAAAAANARTQAAAMAVAAQVGPPVSAAAAMFGGNPQAMAAMAMTQAGGGEMNMFSAQAQAAAAGYSAQNMVSTPHHPIPEFLYQLTKMLTDDNTTYIEWKEGRIFVYDPPGLADNVLQRYFRHSKYASFQRQLNYFGFRKIAGKGKMSPCSYINENTTDDIRSLLFIKRKTNGPKAAHVKKSGSLGAAGDTSSLASGGRKRKAAASNKPQTRVIPPSEPAPTNLVAQGGNQPYEAVFAQQQALLTAQQQPLTGAPQNYVGVGAPSNAAASMSTSETFHFPSDQAMQQLQKQQQQLQLLQQQKQIQQQQLQQQRQQLEILQAQNNQQAQHQQATTTAGAGSTSMPCPATMAMNAASAANALAGGNGGGPTIGGGNSLFGSSANLASLLKTDTTTADAGNGAALGGAQGPSQMGIGGGVAPLSAATSSAFLSSLPSSNTLFPDSMSSLSLNRLFTGATPAPGGMGGGVPSTLGLSGYFSRENSLYNLAMGLPANQSSQALQAMGMSAPAASEPSALPDGNDAAAKIMG